MASLKPVLLSWAMIVCASHTHAAGLLADESLTLMRQAIQQALKAGETAGVAVVVGQRDRTEYLVMGNRAEQPSVEEMTDDTIFDVASLTKVVATTPCALKLLEQGRLELEAPIKTWLPEFTGEGRDDITLRHLLVHASGLASGIPQNPPWTGRDTGRDMALKAKPVHEPDKVFRYSDLNFILLGEIVERVAGRPLDQFATEQIFKPLRMNSTGFTPPESWRNRIAPTAPDDAGKWFRGVVHDPTSRRMGGVTGHAGLFSTAGDLARFARMLLGGGELDGIQIFKEETIKQMTQVHTLPTMAARRGLGWDLDSPFSRTRGEVFPLGVFGHTGFTGTSMWLEPQTQSYIIVLANRLHPDGKGNVLPLQAQLSTLAAQGMLDPRITSVSPTFSPRLNDEETPTVLNGVDVLSRREFADLTGLKVGLITNHTGIDKQRRATIDLLHKAPHVKLRALFSPEHGIRGADDHDKIGDSKDRVTGLPVHSLYGERRAPSEAQLQSLDALVFDIQDIGCRFYTYISTMQKCMEAAAKTGKKFFVLDRVNPTGGVTMAGPATLSKESFVGCHPIPLQHGMTVGELALMMNAERDLKCDVKVIPLEGWRRDLDFDHTGLPWLNPSPNMRSLNAALLYPGIGLLESAVSVGRGTDTPFEVVGAPYVDDVKLAHILNHAGLKGVRFVPERFTPKTSTFKGRVCGGVRIIVTERKNLRAVDLGIAIACALQRSHTKEFNLWAMEPLLLHSETLQAIKDGKQPWAQIVENWAAENDAFAKRREAFLLYR